MVFRGSPVHDATVAGALEHHLVLDLVHPEELLSSNDQPGRGDQPAEFDLPAVDRLWFERVRRRQVADVADEELALVRDPRRRGHRDGCPPRTARPTGPPVARPCPRSSPGLRVRSCRRSCSSSPGVSMRPVAPVASCACPVVVTHDHPCWGSPGEGVTGVDRLSFEVCCDRLATRRSIRQPLSMQNAESGFSGR